ncbi:hypothetical protein H4582DRAFT_1901567 [Lactarius indigo]|nr:hypothetical protein H4582DRAFT_1901567 [Lactarius indigo]
MAMCFRVIEHLVVIMPAYHGHFGYFLSGFSSSHRDFALSQEVGRRSSHAESDADDADEGPHAGLVVARCASSTHHTARSPRVRSECAHREASEYGINRLRGLEQQRSCARADIIYGRGVSRGLHDPLRESMMQRPGRGDAILIEFYTCKLTLRLAWNSSE